MLNWKTCATAASAAMLLAAAAAAAEATEPGRPDDLGLIDDVAADARDSLTQPSDYWLGIIVSRPSPDLQKQLKLPKDQGLLVEIVEAKSPAVAAGVKPNDVLLKANDKPLADRRDLLKLINEVKEGKLTLQLLRDGKQETVVAVLTKRPAWAHQPLGAEAQAWIEKLNSRNGLLFVGPGQIVPPEGAVGVATTKVEVTVHTKASLADGSQVEITREDGKPARVVVTRDKERWEGTSTDLSKIPDNIRPEVQRLLHSREHIRFFASPAGMPGTIVIGGQSVEKRLSEMQKQIDELKQQVRALQDSGKPKKE